MITTPFAKLTFAAIIVFILTIIFYFSAPKHLISNSLLLMVPFFYIVSVISRLIYLRNQKKQNIESNMFYLKASGIKLGIYITVLLVYGFFFRADVVPFFISFLIFYILFSFIEIKLQLRKP